MLAPAKLSRRDLRARRPNADALLQSLDADFDNEDLSDHERERRKFVALVLEAAVYYGVGYRGKIPSMHNQTPEDLLSDKWCSKNNFEKHKKKLVQGLSLSFKKGPPYQITQNALKAEKRVTIQAKKDGLNSPTEATFIAGALTTARLSKNLPPIPEKEPSQYVKNSAIMRSKAAGISMTKCDPTDVSRQHADQDMRNPTCFVAAISVLLLDLEGDYLDPRNVFNFDVTGSCIHLGADRTMKVATLYTATSDGELNKGRRAKNSGSLGLNMKRFSASNAAGNGMVQWYGFKAEKLLEKFGLVHKVVLTGEAHDGGDINIVFSKGSSIGCPPALTMVFEDGLLPFIEKKKAEGKDSFLSTDGDNEQIQTLRMMLPAFSLRNIKVRGVREVCVVRGLRRVRSRSPLLPLVLSE